VDSAATFTPALRLSEGFYRDVVRDLLRGTPHSAAHLGEGSDVLGFDTQRSKDHGWGIRLQVFVADQDVDAVRERIDAGVADQYADSSVRYLKWQTGKVEHHMEVSIRAEWFIALLGFDPLEGVTTPQWLGLPHQLLLEATGGAVFHDDSGELTVTRERLAWYPQDEWLWIMACQWSLIGSTLPFVGRASEVDDEVGSRLVAAKIARWFMKLFLLQERRYAPYDKWLGSAVRRLGDGETLTSLVAAVLDAGDYSQREAALARICEAALRRHNSTGFTEAVKAEIGPHRVGIADAVRPYRVMDTTPIVQACLDRVDNPSLRGLNLVGALDQLVDASDPLIHFTDWPTLLAAIYEAKLAD
jgi:hypothetical protein